MDDMIDRVAKAIGDGASVCGAPWDAFTDADKLKLRNAARAAIEAIREPTREMLVAVALSEETLPARVWRRMIDEILK